MSPEIHPLEVASITVFLFLVWKLRAAYVYSNLMWFMSSSYALYKKLFFLHRIAFMWFFFHCRVVIGKRGPWVAITSSKARTTAIETFLLLLGCLLGWGRHLSNSDAVTNTWLCYLMSVMVVLKFEKMLKSFCIISCNLVLGIFCIELLESEVYNPCYQLDV